MILGLEKILDFINPKNMRPPAPENVVRGGIPFDPGNRQEVEELRKELGRIGLIKNAFANRYDETISDLELFKKETSRLRDEKVLLKQKIEDMEEDQTRFDMLDL